MDNGQYILSDEHTDSGKNSFIETAPRSEREWLDWLAHSDWVGGCVGETERGRQTKENQPVVSQFPFCPGRCPWSSPPPQRRATALDCKHSYCTRNRLASRLVVHLLRSWRTFICSVKQDKAERFSFRKNAGGILKNILWIYLWTRLSSVT